MKEASIIILAAGLGTRMKSSLPKVLHEVSDEPMIYHIVNEARKLSEDIHIVLYHQHELIKNRVESYFDDLNYHLQDFQNFPGTGGAVMGIAPKHENVLILSGDMPLVEAKDLKPLLKTDAKVQLCAFRTKNPTGYGRVVTDESLNVKYIVEEKDASLKEKKIDLVNAGVYAFKKDFLEKYLPKLSSDNAQKEYYLTDLLGFATKDEIATKVHIVDEDNFMGVNSKEQLLKAQELMQDRIKSFWMEKGVSFRLGKSSFIGALVSFKGECFIENGVSIVGECEIDSSTIKANSVIESSNIENSTIGPLARVRPGSSIKNSSIGNFVEVKNSSLNGVKAAHLSYLGDCEIGSGTNVGCGTVTCNYDGRKKHKTIIGKNVFIGSGAKLIAPLKIEDNTIIGAGSVINKDVEEHSLALSRPNLKIIKNFYQKYFKKD